MFGREGGGGKGKTEGTGNLNIRELLELPLSARDITWREGVWEGGRRRTEKRDGSREAEGEQKRKE